MLLDMGSYGYVYYVAHFRENQNICYIFIIKEIWSYKMCMGIKSFLSPYAISMLSVMQIDNHSHDYLNVTHLVWSSDLA